MQQGFAMNGIFFRLLPVLVVVVTVLLLLVDGTTSTATLSSWTKFTVDQQVLTAALAHVRSRHADGDGGACANFVAVNKSDLSWKIQHNNKRTAVNRKWQLEEEALDDEEEPPWAADYIKVWRSSIVTEVFESILGLAFSPNSKTTVREVFGALQQEGCNVYPHGGAVRDVLLNLTPKDIDIAFSCSAPRIGEIAKNHGWQVEVQEENQYVKIGSQSCCYQTLEGNTVTMAITQPLIDQEFTTNSLAFDVNGNNVIIDAAGTGLEDTCARTLRISAPRNEWTAWRNAYPKKLLRFWKLRAEPKSFLPDNETLQFVVEQFENETYWEEKLKPLTGPFFCKTLIEGNSTKEGGCIACCPSSRFKQRVQNWTDAVRSDLGDDWFETHMQGLDENFECSKDSCTDNQNSKSNNSVSGSTSIRSNTITMSLFTVICMMWLGIWIALQGDLRAKTAVVL